MKDFRPIQGKTLSSQIVTQVRDALFAGSLKPGDVLGSESELAKKFAVSRMSVRDALRTLEAMGIVEIRMGAGGGARVAQGSMDRFSDALAIQLALVDAKTADVMQAQGAIESVTVELAAGNATHEDLDRMRELLKQAERNLDDPVSTNELGEAFHLAVAVASHNEVLLAQLNAIRHVLWRPARNRADRTVAERVLTVHRNIFEKIEAGDAAGARAVMSEHLRHLLEVRTSARAARKTPAVETDEACFSEITSQAS